MRVGVCVCVCVCVCVGVGVGVGVGVWVCVCVDAFLCVHWAQSADTALGPACLSLLPIDQRVQANRDARRSGESLVSQHKTGTCFFGALDFISPRVLFCSPRRSWTAFPTFIGSAPTCQRRTRCAVPVCCFYKSTPDLCILLAQQALTPASRPALIRSSSPCPTLPRSCCAPQVRHRSHER